MPNETDFARRGLLAAGATFTAATMISGGAAQAQAAARTFVLVHGSWHGGWCWRRVADRLERGGHKVYTPTLTGLGERVHLLNTSVDLNTHITDVVNVIRFEELKDIILVGHSYAGCVISGVAEQILPAIASIVFVDAFLPEDGQRMLDLTPANLRDAAVAAQSKGEIVRPIVPAAAFKVNAQDQAWVNAKLTPQPLGPTFTPNKYSGAREKIARKT